ncbi:MAG: hypothetical protein IT485_05460 [Gammaproteobacteria bacterium]|nr:hypothetical protein [Gammaproteobacteria bacterium]QOJ31973.1 MAG: hypothetical protein HRU81_07640 [Gammaproteobacteria bacterium]
MGTMAWIVMGVAIGVLTPFLVVQYQRRRDLVRAGPVAPAARRDLSRPGNPFAAVSVRPCADHPCKAVLAMAGTRYLAVRAPTLPVAGCDHRSCGCRFVRHADRRTSGDRRDLFARFGGLLPNANRERRHREDRRK